MDILQFNPWLTASAFAWFAAQFSKLVLELIVHRKVDFYRLVDTGGMPSSHTALVTGLSTAVAMTEGFHSATFAIASMFSLIVIYDATNLRRSAGYHATYLNEIVEQLQHGKVLKGEKFTFRRLRELLGHNPVEVFVGAIVGIAIGIVVIRWLGA